MGAPATAVVADSELIARYLGGDESAAAELVRRHTAALARFVAFQGVPADDLEDVVQDAFFKAFRSLKSFRGGSSFRTWLLTIGANLVKDLRRRWQRRQVLALSPDVADPGADPALETEAALLAARLTEGIGRLARMRRQVFLLRAHEGLEYDEIARALGISEGAARVHYHHAVKRLKAWIR